jgi:predicted AAA+ superfamily ATPase
MERKFTRALKTWKEKEATRPLLVYGARQTGKSYAVARFGRENYQSFVTVNFEEFPFLKNAFSVSVSPRDVVRSLEAMLQTKIDERNTLMFFDEIQKCPPALTALKYFAEDAESGRSHYNVIAAGSLLGVTLERTAEEREYTFPVGKVQELIVYPMDFEEFLWARGERWLAEAIKSAYEKKSPLDEQVHRQALTRYRQHLIVGGMPKVVADFMEGRDYAASQRDILNAYLADMTRYSDKRQGLRNIDAYNSLAAQLAGERENKRFIFSRIEKTTNGSRDYRDSVGWLVQAKLALRCVKMTVGDMPPKASEDKSYFKLYLSDTGLLCHQLQVTETNLEIFDQNYRGALTENYVASALYSKIQSLSRELYYWKLNEKTGSAEVDFIITTDEGNIPLEVKSSRNNRSRSLGIFVDKYAPNYALRVSSRNFGVEKNIVSLPLYAVFCVDGLL